MIVVWRKSLLLLLLLCVAGLLVLCVSFGPSSEAVFQRCKPRDNIFFLKTHKCGSSTVQNILMRRGHDLGLNFVLPPKDNYLGHPEPFKIEHVDPELMDSLGTFNIFAHHSRFNPQTVRQIMPEDTRFVSIVREPWSLFESLFHYYALQELLLENKVNLKTLLTLPVEQIDDIFAKSHRLGYRIGINQVTNRFKEIMIGSMAFDFGFASKHFKDEAKIEELLRMIDSQFDLVMVAEYMEVSMVLLADLMCWPLEQVTFLTLNARPSKSPHRTSLSAEEKLKIAAFNNVDDRIYRHIRKKLKERVLAFGVERMAEAATRLATLNAALLRECVQLVVSPKNGTSPLHYYPVNRYLLYDDAPLHCRQLVLNELKFTDELRDLQRKRFAIRSDLQLLLHT